MIAESAAPTWPLVLGFMLLGAAILAFAAFTYRLAAPLLIKWWRTRNIRVKKVECEKCNTSGRPGYIKAGQLDPQTGEMHYTYLECDRCATEGYYLVIERPSELTDEEWLKIVTTYPPTTKVVSADEG